MVESRLAKDFREYWKWKNSKFIYFLLIGKGSIGYRLLFLFENHVSTPPMRRCGIAEPRRFVVSPRFREIKWLKLTLFQISMKRFCLCIAFPDAHVVSFRTTFKEYH